MARKKSSIISIVAIVLVLIMGIGLLGSFLSPEDEESQNGKDGVNGVGIVNIAKTSTVGLKDTYTIYYTNGNTSTFTITNGSNGQDMFLPDYFYESGEIFLEGAAEAEIINLDDHVLQQIDMVNAAVVLRKDDVVHVSMSMETNDGYYCQFPLTVCFDENQILNMTYSGSFPAVDGMSSYDVTMCLNFAEHRIDFSGNSNEYCAELAAKFALSTVRFFVLYRNPGV